LPRLKSDFRLFFLFAVRLPLSLPSPEPSAHGRREISEMQDKSKGKFEGISKRELFVELALPRAEISNK
jgi:hypothetical protein